MKKYTLSILSSLIAFSFIQTAQAGILLEPYLGYHLMAEEDSANADFSGLGYGLRVGFSHLGLLVGAGYESASWDVDNSGTSGSHDVDLTELYAFVGYEFPVLLRAWVGYAFQSKTDFGTSGDASGNGIRLGVGYTGLPFASINLEMQERKSFSVDGADLNFRENDKFTSFMLSVSIPFVL